MASENLVALKLTLSALGESTSIAGFNDRKRIQKAIYLGQAAGVDLGYWFGWYVFGPYSTALTRDYFELNDPDVVGHLEGSQLRTDAAEKLKAIVPLLNKSPTTFKGDKEAWMELLASYHFLRSSGHPHEKAVELLEQRKPHLAPHAEEARQALTKYSLLEN